MRFNLKNQLGKLRPLSIGMAAFLYAIFVTITGAGLLFASRQKVAAFVDNDSFSVAVQQNRTKLYAVGVCLTRGGLKEVVTSEELNNRDIYYSLSGTSVNEVGVGHEIVTDDGTSQCKNINHDQALGFLGDDWNYVRYRDALYERDGTTAFWNLKDNAEADMDEVLIAARTPKRQSENSAVGPDEFKRRVAVALARCIEDVPEGQVATRPVQIGDTEYQWRGNKGGGDRVSVGHDLDSQGSYECRELIEYAQPGGVGELSLPDGITINDLHENPQALAAYEENGGDAAGAVAPPGDDTETGPTCESEGGAMAWILCSVIAVLDAAITKLDGMISNLLNVQESDLQKAEMKEAAKRIRNFAYIILIPMMLVMVIGTALGFEFISAYTVKRALPRLVAATIFIALSYQIATFLVAFTNTLGRGIAGLILQPLTNGNATLESILSPAAAGQVGGGILFAGIVAGIAIGPAIIGVLLSYALVVFVVLLMAFVILALRQVLILVLALLAPLAILAWIFPNNDKLWKLWWGTFTKLLLVYPIIELLIAAGKAFASFAFTTQDPPVFGALLAVTAYIVPFFFIPAAFKWAGGVFGTLTGMVNDRSKGFFDKQKAFRGETAKGGWNEFKAGKDSRGPRGALSRGVGRHIGAGWKGRYGMGRSGRAGMEAGAAILGQEMAESSQIWQANKNNDKFLTAHANEAIARKRQREEAAKGNTESVQAWEQAIQAAKLVPSTQATRMAAAQQWAATGYNLAAGQQGYHELAQTMADITGNQYDARTGKVTGSNLASYANAMNNAQYGLKGATRFDLAGINDGAGFDLGAGVGKASLYELANAKKDTLKGVGQSFETISPENVDAAAVWLQELKAMQPNAKGGNADFINEEVARLESDTMVGIHMAANGESVRARARSYQRPDVNNITE